MTVYEATVRSALDELADEAYQRRVWLAADGPEMSSLQECVESLFDDSGLSAALAKGGYIFGSPVDELLRQLEALTSKIDADQAPQALIDDPRLAEARVAAARIRSMLLPSAQF